jgi:hypothetical protein
LTFGLAPGKATLFVSHAFDMPSQSLSVPPPPTFAGRVHAACAGMKNETFPNIDINKINVKKMAKLSRNFIFDSEKLQIISLL